MKDFLLGIVYLVVVIFVLRLIGRLLIKWIYYPLVSICDDHDLDSSPWGFTIWEVILIYEYINRTGYELFFKDWIYTRWLSLAGYGWAVLALAALPLVVMLIQTKVVYFIPLLLAKLLGIPFFILAFFVGMPKDDEEAANERLSRALDKAAERGMQVPQRGGTPYRSSGEPHGPSSGDTEDVSRTGGFDSRGLYWAKPEQDAPPASSAPRSRQDGYHDFDAQGEYREHDADYSPMDET